MKIITYWNKSPDNVVNKTISKINEYSNVIFHTDGDFSIIKPRIILSGVSDIVNVKHINYVEVSAVDRYYFITDITTNNGLVVLDCKCDVLMSFKDDILRSGQLPQYVLRQQTRNLNPYLTDALMPIRADHNYKMKKFGNPVGLSNCNNVILATAGKGGRII